jgi:myo-inositol-1(or 4)-monophosphatase
LARAIPFLKMSSKPSELEILDRIGSALEAAAKAVGPYCGGRASVSFKQGDDPVTEADRLLDGLLHNLLLRDGEGWLSEETRDDLSRLDKSRIWIVDPLDGTREFVAGIPEWCISVGYVEDGRAVAGGICNPATGETFLGGVGAGITLNGKKVSMANRKSLAGANVLASRSEVKRGDWRVFDGAPFEIIPMGSVAYKLARVAGGLADATWTVCPKHEWDIAAGVALVNAAGGLTRQLDGNSVMFNSRNCLLPNFLAIAPSLEKEVETYLGQALPA